MRPRLLLAIVGWLSVAVTTLASAAEPLTADREYQVRAGYLLNFVKFVEWPQGVAVNSWTFCFAGADRVREVIANLPVSKQRPVTVRALAPRDPVTGCNVLYVDSSAPDINERLANLASQPILTVSDAHGFTHYGGVVQLFTEGNRLRFDINLDNARRAGLRISSSLLQLASHVEETGR